MRPAFHHRSHAVLLRASRVQSLTTSRTLSNGDSCSEKAVTSSVTVVAASSSRTTLSSLRILLNRASPVWRKVLIAKCRRLRLREGAVLVLCGLDGMRDHARCIEIDGLRRCRLDNRHRQKRKKDDRRAFVPAATIWIARNGGGAAYALTRRGGSVPGGPQAVVSFPSTPNQNGAPSDRASVERSLTSISGIIGDRGAAVRPILDRVDIEAGWCGGPRLGA